MNGVKVGCKQRFRSAGIWVAGFPLLLGWTAAAEPLLFIRMPSAARAVQTPTPAQISEFIRERARYLDSSNLDLLRDPALAGELLGESQIFEEVREFERLHSTPVRIKFIDWKDAFRYFADYVADPANSPAVVQLGDTWAGHFRSLGVVAYENSYDWDVRVLWYWKHLIEPGQVRDAAGFLSACRALKQKPPPGLVSPYVIPTAPSWDLVHDLSVWLLNSGASSIVSVAKLGPLTWQEAEFAGPEGERAARFLIRLAREDLVALPEQEGSEVGEAFLDGKYAMVILGPWIAGRARSKVGVDWESKVGVTFPPSLGDEPPTTLKSGSSLVVLDPSRGRRKAGVDQGVLLVEFLTSGASQVRCARDFGDLPSSPEALAGLPYSDFFKTAGERAKSYPAIPAWGPLVENLVTRDNLYAFWKRLAALGRTEGLVSEAEQRSRESLVLAALLSAQVEINRDLSIGKLSAWLPWVAAALAGLSLVTVFSLWRRCVDRRRSRLALAESEAKFRDLYDHAPDMFCSVDVADGRIVECNQTLVSKSGYSKEEIVGRPVFDLYHPECRDRARRALQSFRETGHLDELELELQTRDGQRLAVSVGVSAIRDQKGNIVRTRSVWRDISRRKHAEEVAEQRRQELAYVARLATVGELAASLAHELDQPLTAVVANAQAGMRLIVREPPSLRKVGEILHDIAGEGQRAAQVIKALRDLLRKDDLQMTEVDINEVIKDILSSLRGQPSLRKVALLLHLETGLPHILGDRIQLEQVVLNLILNAAEAMQGVEGGAGELKIRTSASALGEVEVTVWDTGVGMDEAAKEKIFDAFFTTKPGALGMGLSISRTIIEAHGGRIWATRNPDRGATLHFTLPSRSDQRPIS